MSKFKVGDRVRWTRVPTQFQNATVSQVCRGLFDYQIAEDGETGYAYEHELERRSSGADTIVRKGDKFRVNVNDECSGYANGDVFVAVSVGIDRVRFYDNDGDFRSIAHEDITFVDDNGEPWDYDPRGKLRIEAGKYYRTRDGRKVGPTTKNEYGLFGAPGFASNEWYECGNCSPGTDYDKDLIAEWTDETDLDVSEIPTKFKVGDRVRVVNYPAAESEWDGVSGTVKAIGPFYINADLDNGFKGALLLPSEIEHPLSTPITPGTRVLIEGVVNSIDGKTAHVDIIGPDVPYNRSYPLSALRAA